jgi:hypothetical protein
VLRLVLLGHLLPLYLNLLLQFKDILQLLLLLRPQILVVRIRHLFLQLRLQLLQLLQLHH